MDELAADSKNMVSLENAARLQVSQLIRLLYLCSNLGPSGLTTGDTAALVELADTLQATINGYDDLIAAYEEGR